MRKEVSYKIVSLIFGVLVLCFAIAFYAVGWTEPTTAPPGGNVYAPINVGPTGQIKTGALRVGGLTVDNDTYLATSAGNVGIGTTEPSQKLDVAGYVKGQTGLCIGDDCRNSWDKAFYNIVNINTDHVNAGTEPKYLTRNDFGKLITLFNNAASGDPIDVVLPGLSSLSSDDVGKYFMFATYNAVGPSGTKPFRIITYGAHDTFYGNVNDKKIYGYISEPRLTSVDGAHLEADWDNDAFTVCKVYFMEESDGDRYWLFDGSPLAWDDETANYLSYPFTGI